MIFQERCMVMSELNNKGKVKYYSAVIFVKDINVSKKFYQELLDAAIEHDFGKNVSFYGGLSIWELRESHVIPQNVADYSTPSNRLELYFETDDLDAFYKKLEAQEVNILHKKHQEPWGQYTIRFFDPDNHLIEVGESMEAFLSRFHKMGLNAEEISEKSFVPVETIKRVLNIQ